MCVEIYRNGWSLPASVRTSSISLRSRSPFCHLGDLSHFHYSRFAACSRKAARRLIVPIRPDPFEGGGAHLDSIG